MTFDNTQPHPSDALSLTELTFYHQIMAYRAAEGLDAIPLSLGLTTTAGRHAADTTYNIWEARLDLPDGTDLRSWSDAPYFSDERDVSVMTQAPQRIGTGYSDAGYEIAASGFLNSATALEEWKKFSGINDMLLNEGAWSILDWDAIGIGIETHATLPPIYYVWFGDAADSDGAPKISGTDAADTIEGTEFNDKITGGKDADIITGGAGRDQINGGSGGDDLSGDGGGDRLIGKGGRDDLSGGGGKDKLIGGKGNDTLSGGAKSDLFIFSEANFGKDRITDYNGDRVRITSAGEAQNEGELTAALSEKNGNTIYDHGNDGQNRIIFENTALNDLDLSLFDLG